MSRISSAHPGAFQPIGPAPIEGVLLVERFQCPRGHRFEASSLPGHLLHVVVRGRVRQTCNGRAYELGPRSAIWYHEDEHVVGEVLAPWTFYSVNFIAPAMPPPELGERALAVRWTDALRACRRLYAAWRSSEAEERRTLAVHAALGELLLCLAPRPAPVRMEGRARLWWLVESRVRERLDHPPTLAELAKLAGASRAAVERACHAATGTSPMQRMKSVRLSLARGLLGRADLGIGEIAARVGYGRIHEFSRDYARRFGAPPSRDPRRRLLQQR